MLERDGRSYYQFNGDKLEASVIHNGASSGKHPHSYCVRIHPEDGGIVTIGYLPVWGFDLSVAQSIVDAALDENKDYAWWTKNAYGWFVKNAIMA